jgi:hypothetical protein
VNSNGLLLSPTVTRSEEPSRVALVIGVGVLSSDGSPWNNPPSSLSEIRDGVTDPVKPDRFRTADQRDRPFLESPVASQLIRWAIT